MCSIRAGYANQAKLCRVKLGGFFLVQMVNQNEKRNEKEQWELLVIVNTGQLIHTYMSMLAHILKTYTYIRVKVINVYLYILYNLHNNKLHGMNIYYIIKI